MPDRRSGPIGFRSRFSILSLLPARHPPLDPSPPALPELAPRNRVLPPTKNIATRQPSVISISDAVSPVDSEYPIDLDLYSPPILPPVRPPAVRQTSNLNSAGSYPSHYAATPDFDPSEYSAVDRKVDESGEMRRGHRPPPLDLSRTKRVYPGLAGVVAVPGTAPTSPPIPAIEKDDPSLKMKGKEKKAKAPRIREDDPFDVVELESTHRYPSWQGGKVDIKPGQLIPPIMLGNTPTIRGIDPSSVGLPPRSTSRHITPPRKPHNGRESPQFDSVLHDVILTPNFLGQNRTPNTPPSPSPSSPSDRRWLNFSNTRADRSSRRRTLVDTIRRGSRIIREPRAERSIRQMREKEAQEMDRFKSTDRHVRIADDCATYSTYSPYLHPGGGLHPRKSPGSRDWDAGVTWGDVDRKGNKGNDGKMWRETKLKAAQAKKRRLWKIAIIAIIVLLAALTIGLCTTLLTRSSDDKSNTDNKSDVSVSDSETTLSSYPTPSSSPSRTLSTCLELFANSAPASPLSYPCSDCVPLLTSTTNDYNAPLSNGNSTGVGAALQFCALNDIFRVTGGNGLDGDGWMKDGSPCGWSGVTCDSRGRITELQMRYPKVPDKLSATITNIVGLTSLRLMGNTTIPGDFPTGLLALSNLTTLDIEYTGLTGRLASMNFDRARNISRLVLVNNANLGTAFPSFASNAKLNTLVITGQGLSSFSSQSLPTSLEYLDLSYNAFSGAIPSLSSLQSLQTLYLTNNNFTAPPAALPVSISSLSLTANPELSGYMPASLCISSALTTCDLRSTKLQGADVGGLIPNGISAGSQTSATATGTTGISVGIGGKVCGPCQFDK